MSALGQKRTHAVQQKGSLFDHLVGGGQQRGRNGEAERLCSLEIDNEFVLGRRLHRHVGWLLTLQDAIDISSSSLDRLPRIGTVTNEATIYGVISIRVNRRKFVASDKTDYEFAISRRTACCYDHTAIARTCERRHVSFYFIGVAHV